jgi:hypothetical protein
MPSCGCQHKAPDSLYNNEPGAFYVALGFLFQCQQVKKCSSVPELVEGTGRFDKLNDRLTC